MKKLIAFFEIPASDFHRAVDFYETVLGMQLPTFECETEKMACFTEEGETVGAISYASNLQSPNQKIPDRKTKCVIETHLNIKQNVILGANLKPV